METIQPTQAQIEAAINKALGKPAKVSAVALTDADFSARFMASRGAYLAGLVVDAQAGSINSVRSAKILRAMNAQKVEPLGKRSFIDGNGNETEGYVVKVTTGTKEAPIVRFKAARYAKARDDWYAVDFKPTIVRLL